MAITDYKITTHFRETDWFHSKPHQGIDIATPTGTKIYSQDSGIVSLTIDNLLGNTVRLKINNGDIIVYGHLSKFEVQNDQYVEQGTLLGLTGGAVGSLNSGRTTGSHVHISQYHDGVLIDPTDYLFSEQQSDSSLVFPIMLILLLIVCWKVKKFLFYGLGLFLLLIVILIVS